MTMVLTNDDGVGARGLMTMRAASYTNPVRAHRCDDGLAPVYAVAGTPVDCVRVALGALAPDAALVISGVNHGCNIGEDMLNSGTVGAAVESALFGVPAIAISQQAVPGHLAIVEPPDARFTDFTHSAGVAVALARAILDRRDPRRVDAMRSVGRNRFRGATRRYGRCHTRQLRARSQLRRRTR